MKRHLPWILPLVLWLAVIPFTPSIDMIIERYFYRDGHFSNSAFYEYIYNYAALPALLFGLGSFLVFGLSFFIKRFKTYRKLALYFALVLGIGSGLIVNVILKDHWGQPRPKQLIEFGGTKEYRPIWKPNFFADEPAKAFPCGHCAMGFYFFALVMLAKQNGKRCLFWSALIFTIFLGTLLSLARMAQGGHFFSGVITSALIMWLLAYFLFPTLPGRAQNRLKS